MKLINLYWRQYFITRGHNKKSYSIRISAHTDQRDYSVVSLLAPRVIKLFFMHDSTEFESSISHKT